MSVRVVRFGTVGDLRSRSAYQPDCSALARNRIAVARASAGMSPEDFAALLGQLTGRTIAAGHVTSWETRTTPPGDVLIAADTVSPSSSARIGVRSHKFIACHVGAKAAARLSGLNGWIPASFGGLGCRSTPVQHPSGQCVLHAWPFGSAVFHLAEDLEVSDVSALALWRVQSYGENLTWATEMLRQMTGDSNAAGSYVLSLYWVHTPAWSGRLLTTALRLICCPRILLERENCGGEVSQGSAEEAERVLLADGYEHPKMRAFGQRGVSVGFASWSGVSYLPADPGRALAEDELVAYELALQSVWAYCERINARVEENIEPDVPDGYGSRFLRAARSALTNPRPQETGQYQAMREAVSDTSRIASMLDQALEVLREDGR